MQNACVFGHTVRITVQATDQSCRWLVEDDGPGVPVAEREKVFHPFWTGRPEGTGLGLALAQTLAHAHGGDLRVAASAELGGACFVLEIPR